MPKFNLPRILQMVAILWLAFLMIGAILSPPNIGYDAGNGVLDLLNFKDGGQFQHHSGPGISEESDCREGSDHLVVTGSVVLCVHDQSVRRTSRLFVFLARHLMHRFWGLRMDKSVSEVFSQARSHLLGSMYHAILEIQLLSSNDFFRGVSS